MRKYILGGVVAALLVVLCIGLLPPVLARSKVDHAASTAAKAGSAVLASGVTAADTAALRSIAAQSNMHIVSMGPVPGKTGTFAVTVQERVHTFMDRFSELTSWFVVSSTEQSSV
jgi:hypothetical protein